MSRTGRDKRLRLRLFQLGNDRCPICLAGFTEAAVQEGEEVTLEHVPAQSLNADGLVMCLTCADCNNSTSKAEKVASDMDRAPDQGWKVQLTMDRGRIPIHTGYMTGDRPITNPYEYLGRGETGPITIRTKGLRVSEEEFSRALRRPDQTIRMQYAFDARYASVAWLKAAYLSVFSLLGQGGYLYAQGEAIERVREQIRKPGQETLRYFDLDAPSDWREGDGALMNHNRGQKPCWAVKMKDRLVLLPMAWDTSFYEWVNAAMNGKGMRLGGGPFWYPAQFERVTSFTLANGYDPKQVGADLFARTGKVTHEDGVVPIVVADYGIRHVTMLSTGGLSRRGHRASSL